MIARRVFQSTKTFWTDVDDIESLGQTITAKDVLEGQISALENDKRFVLRLLANSYSEDTLGADLIALNQLYSSSGDKEDLINYAHLLYEQGQLTSAIMQLVSIIQDPEVPDYLATKAGELKSYYQIISAGSAPLWELDSNQVIELTNIVNTGVGLGKQLALSSLIANGVSVNYNVPRFLPNQGLNKRVMKVNDIVRLQEAPKEVDVFPNPFKNNLVIRWNWLDNGFDENLKIQLINSQGEIIQQLTEVDYQANQKLLKLEDIPLGVYFLQIISKGTMFYGETIIKRS